MGVIEVIDWAIYTVGRVACRVLRRHNASCRGRSDHTAPDGGLIDPNRWRW
jgi:hypothetical protein